MTKLNDQLHDAVNGVTVDLDALTAAARRQGLAKRRLRRSLATVGSAAAVVAIGAVGWAVAPQGTVTPDRPTGFASPGATTSPSAPQVAGEVRLTGQITAAILMELVADQVSADVAQESIAGQGGVDLVDRAGNVVLSAEENTETYAEFQLANDRGGSTLGINIQLGEGTELDCDSRPGAQDCRVQRRKNGDQVMTFRDSTDKPGMTRLVAELVRGADGMRVAVASTAPTGATHPIDPDHLLAVATNPIWGRTVPAEYEAKGSALTGFTWVGGLIDTWTAPVPLSPVPLPQTPPPPGTVD